MKHLFLTLVILCTISLESSGQLNWIITAKGVGQIELGQSISETRQLIPDSYTTQSNEKGGFDILEGSTKLISVWSKHGDGSIGFIKIFSQNFQTKDGLRTGLTINQIESIRTDFFLKMDEMSGRGYFMPVELQTPNEEFYTNLNLLYFKAPKGKKLAVYEFNEKHQAMRAIQFESKSILEFFYIYQWK